MKVLVVEMMVLVVEVLVVEVLVVEVLVVEALVVEMSHKNVTNDEEFIEIQDDKEKNP